MTTEYPQPAGGPSGTVDLAQLRGLIWQRKGVVIGIAATIFGLVLALTLWSTVAFTTSARLYLGELSSTSAPAGEEAELSPTLSSDVNSEAEILSSRSLIGKAILQSGVNARISVLGDKTMRYWRWRSSGRDPALVDGALSKVKVVNTDFTDRTRAPVTFVVRFTTADVYDLSAEDDPKILGTGRLGTPLEAAGLRVELVKSTDAIHPGDAFELTVTPLSLMIDDVTTRLHVTIPKTVGTAKPNVVALDYTDTSPTLTANLLNSLMSAYLGERQQWKTQDASAAEDFVASQLENIRASRDKAQKELADFRSNNRVVVLDSEAESMIGQISRYEEQRVASRLEAEALADVDRALKSANPAPEAFMVGEAQDNVLAGLAESLSESRRKLTELETRFSAEAPDVISQREQVKAQLGTIRSYVSNRLNRARENLGTLGGVIGRYEERLKTIPGAELKLAQLTRESEVFDSMYAFLLKRQQQAAITKASTISKNRVIDEPEIPYKESAPQLGLRIASLPLGLLLGILFVLLGRMFSQTYHSSAEVYGSLGSTAVFATLPQGLPETKRLGPANGASHDLPEHQVSFGFLEAFRTLRTNLYVAAPPQPRNGRVVLITSPSPGDGKTTSALSLAWILAADGKKVLVIDADLRKPSHFLLAGNAQRVNESTDLRSVLTGECTWQDAAMPMNSTQRSIYLLGVSKSAPAELLSANNLRPLLNQARREFDYIILDSPSFPLVSDALVMAPSADVVLSVIRPEHTPRRLAADHVQRLSQTSSVHAVIVNDAQRQDIYGGAYPNARQFGQSFG